MDTESNFGGGGGALITWVNCPVCDQRDCLLLLQREAFISQSATVQSLQLSLKPLHTVTCGELWSGNKTNLPVRSLGSMWGRCIDLRALLLHCTKQRGTHYTIPLGAILISALSEKDCLPERFLVHAGGDKHRSLSRWKWNHLFSAEQPVPRWSCTVM